MSSLYRIKFRARVAWYLIHATGRIVRNWTDSRGVEWHVMEFTEPANVPGFPPLKSVGLRPEMFQKCDPAFNRSSCECQSCEEVKRLMQGH